MSLEILESNNSSDFLLIQTRFEHNILKHLI